MDEDDRDSNAFSENDQDEVMDDVDEPENDPEPEPEPEEEEEDGVDDEYDADPDAEPEPEAAVQDSRGGSGAGPVLGSPGRGLEAAGAKKGTSAAADGTAVDSEETMASTASAASARNSATPGAASSSPFPTPRLHLRARPEALAARLYDIVPTMAAPQATSINALAMTPDLRYWMTGGTDGYIRKYDGPGTINGKQLLTVAQRHPFVDSVVKAGILMSYWENEEPPTTSARGAEEHILSPVYSLAVHSRALWLLSGTEGGSINLQSVRHDEGKRITCLQRHTNAVSVLQLAPDEKSVLSGSWDKNIFDWDLNTGQVRRQFDGSGGQVSVIELRPASGAPIPDQGLDEEPVRDSDRTLASSNAKPLPNGVVVNMATAGHKASANGDISASAASATINGDEPVPDHESLFGSPGGSLFGGSDAMGANPFGDDDIGMPVGSVAIGEEVESFSQHGDMALDGGDATTDVFASTAIPTKPPSENIPASGGDASAAAVTGGDAADAQMSGTMTPAGQANAHGDDKTENNSAPPATTTTAEADGIQGGTAANIASPSFRQKQEQEEQQKQDLELQQSAETQLLELEGAQPIRADTAGATGDQEQQPPAATVYSSEAPPAQFDPTQISETTFFSASIDGTIRVWDRRQSLPVARIENRPGVPPWCMGACWSPDGNRIYAGRRNGIVEEFDIHKARAGWQPERALRFPAGSGPVSAVRAMVNGRHLICASHDILRLYDLQDTYLRHSSVPFLIVPGPPRAGVISHLYIDRTCRFMISTAGNRGWEGTNTEVLIGYEISPVVR